MIKCALIGCDIGYTRSPEVHRAIAAALGEEIAFDVIDVANDGLGAAVGRLLDEYDGFFVTKPYKNDVKKYLSSVDTRCGVNLVRCADRSGHNTDGVGFIRALDRAFDDWRDRVNGALVLGAGGAAYSVAESLLAAGKRVYVLNRTMLNAAKLTLALGAELYVNQPAELVVNCTSLGLHGEDVLTGLCVPPQFDYAFDLIYSPPETPFLKRCAAAGARIANGRDMLAYQAIEGDLLLLNRQADVNGVFEKVDCILERNGG